MAASNRTTLQAALAALSATIDWGTGNDLQAYLLTILESITPIRDDTLTVTATTSTQAIDYSGYDYAVLTLNTGGSCEISFTNIAQGEVKWLKIDNTNLESWTYTGVTDETRVQGTLESLTSIIYIVYNKDGTLHIMPMVNDLSAASTTTMQTGTSTGSYATPAGVKYVTRHGYHSLSHSESYTTADGVGKIEIPTGVTLGAITLPVIAVSAGHEIKIYSTGGSGVSVAIPGGSPDIVSFTANNEAVYYCNGTTWTRIRYTART